MCDFTCDNNRRGGNPLIDNKRGTGLGRLLPIIISICLAMMLQELIMPCAGLMMTPTQLPPPLPSADATHNTTMAAEAAAANSNDLAHLTAMTNKTSDDSSAHFSSSSPSLDASTAAPPLRKGPPQVILNKCCLFGEYLDKSKTCVPGATDKWVPLIYLTYRSRHFTPLGSKPKFITFLDNVFPISKARDLNAPSTLTGEEEEISCTVDDLVLFTGNSNFVLSSNGSLFIPERSLLLPPSRYCVDQQAALVCFQKPKEPEPSLKFKKCCGQHKIYNSQKNDCEFPSFSRNLELNVSLPQALKYQTHFGFPTCRNGSMTYAIAGNWSDSRLLSELTGDLHVPHHQKNLTSDDYCLEYLTSEFNASAPNVKIFACLHHFDDQRPSRYGKHQLAALNVGLVISVIFLAATLVASYMMPSIHHVLHWRCQIYYVMCLFLGKFLLVFKQHYRPPLENMALCFMVASSMHFCFLAAFFWLNTMCFNIWWTFRDFRPTSLERSQELLRLRMYSAYAWGIPLLIAFIAACVNLDTDSPLLRPGFGDQSCWFNRDHLPIFAYFFGPVGMLLCVNIMLFLSTTYQLTCGLWKRDDVKSTTEKTALAVVCLKLVVVMGVTWIVDVVSWLVGGPDDAWFVTDLTNALQGVFIFLVVGCQPQVWAVCKRVCCPRFRQEITNTTNGVQHSSSSQGMPSMAAYNGETTQNTSIHNTTLGSKYGGGGGGMAANHSISANTSTTMKIPMETVC